MRRGKKKDWRQIKSPCIQICTLQNSICVGCGRTQDQIRNWTLYSDEERLSIMETLGSMKNV